MTTATTEAPTVPVSEILATKVSLFRRVTDTETAPEDVALGAILEDIRRGRWSQEIARVRLANTKKKADRLKVELLPAFKPSGTFAGLKDESFVAHSGVLCLDFDNLTMANSHEVRQALRSDHHVVAGFTSPRHGIKAFVPVIARNAAEHHACYEAARAHFAGILPEGVCPDEKPKGIGSNCFVSHDPNAWLATTPRTAFQPINHTGGCDIAIGHVIESNEKELPSLSASGSEVIESARTDPSESEQGAVSTRTPPPAPIALPLFVEKEIWPKWVANIRHRPAERNNTIRTRVPILLNLVHEDVVALLMLRWFDIALPGTFGDPRQRHLYETMVMIKGCLESWPKQERLHNADAQKYLELRDARQRATFRICHSLSLTKENRDLRTFFLSAEHLAHRLGVPHSQIGDRQLEYLKERGVLEQVSVGPRWTPGQKASASRYRWLLG